MSARTSGSILMGIGAIFAAVHLSTAVRVLSMPALLVVEALAPLGFALLIVGIGAAVYRGEIVPEQFAERALLWAVGGAVTLGVATIPLFADALLRGQLARGMPQTIANAGTLGAFVGLVVGVYNARERHQRLRADQLSRINDTLRIATQEVVDATERSELEQAVCARLTQSPLYDSAWIGRYLPETAVVDPVAWAGHDSDYIDSLEISVDPDDPLGQGAGGQAIRTSEMQCVQDVFAEPDMEPWWDLFERKGVESVAVVPLVGAEDVYGFLSIYANRVNAFDDRERTALGELGESIGHAIDSIRARQQLAERERELARQNEQLDEFASVVSHDLRNPLNVAQGSLELARETGEDEHLERAANALDRMNELIEDVLTLARSGQVVTSLTAVDLEAVAERAWATTDTGGATLRIDGDLGRIRADESRLAQLFENLFRNSVEHSSTNNRTQSGDSAEHSSTNDRRTAGPEFRRGGAGAGDEGVAVTVGRCDDGFYVADDGPGIPEAERERVLETGYSTTDEGTGLGLSIVRSIAEAHGWTVSVTEREADGARFEFRGVESTNGSHSEES
nr:GAF domain-containing protein [Haloplanus sp. XH21]